MARFDRTFYSLDIQHGVLYVVRAERRGHRTVLTEVDPCSPTFKAELEAGAFCVSYLSSRESFTRWLEAPMRSMAKAMRVFPTLLDIQLPFALEDCVCSFLGVEPTPGGTVRALSVAARTLDVEKRLATLKERGAETLALDAELLALWFGAQTEFPTKELEQPCVVLWLTDDRTSVAVGSGRRFLGGASTRPGDASQIIRLLETLTGLTAPIPVRWIWAGPGLSNEPAVAALREALEADWRGSVAMATDPRLFLARAVARRAFTGDAFACNLRSGTWAHPVVEAWRRRGPLRRGWSAAVAGLLALVMAGGGWVFTRQAERRLDRDFTNAASSLAGYPVTAKGETAIKIVRSSVAGRQSVVRPLLEPFCPSICLTVRDIAAWAMRSDIRIESLTMTRTSIHLAGSAPSWGSCEPLASFLEQSGYLATLDRKDAGADERIHFTLSSGDNGEGSAP